MPLVVTMLEGGGETPWVAPDELRRLGFSMALYPTTVLFRMTRAIQRALADLHSGRPMPQHEAVSMKQFEEIVELPKWAMIENTFRVYKGLSFLRKLVA